jgi:hypothetical protein
MDTCDLINSSHLERSASTPMQVFDENSEVFYNFIKTLHSDSTKESYRFCLEKFLNHYRIDLASFLELPQQDITNLIIKYLVDKKVSRQYKNLITATIKHACEINDIVLNWKKIKKFINSEKTGNETNGRDRGYTHDEINQEFIEENKKINLNLVRHEQNHKQKFAPFTKSQRRKRRMEVYKLHFEHGVPATRIAELMKVD